MEAIYMDGKRSAEVGDVVTARGNERSVVVDVAGTFVTIVAIGLNKETGQPFIISPADDFPASKCSYLGKAKSSLLAEALAKCGINR